MVKRRDLLLSVFLKVLVVLSVSNHLYDPRRRQFVYSSGAFVYRFSLHLGSFVVVVMNCGQLQSGLGHLIGEKEFLSELSVVCLYVHLFGVTSALVWKWTSRGRGTQPLNELLGVYFQNAVTIVDLSGIHKQALKMCLVISLLAVVILSMSFLTLLTFCLSNGAPIGPSIGLCILQIEVMAFYYRFCATMLFGGCLFKTLNLRLYRVVKQINASQHASRKKSRLLGEELISIGLMRTRLLKSLTRLKEIDQFHILLMLATAFFYQVWAVFFVLVAAMGLFGEVCRTSFFYSTGFTMLGSINLAITLHICAECVDACNSTGAILMGLSAMPKVDRFLESDIARLTLRFAIEKLRLTICGMFDLDARTGPGMMKGITINIILLAQLAYNEL